jgi:predicted Rossmann-fold nucleotide-binding protein
VTRSSRITSKASLLAALESGSALDGCLLLGLDLDAVTEAAARRRGAIVFPPLPPRPYDPYRAALYTPAELMRPGPADPSRSLDEEIAAHFDAAGHPPGLLESLAQRLHDHAIEEALAEVLGPDPSDRLDLVGFMGGHSAGRDADFYARVARTAFLIARAGFRVVTGGGPGMMEAANLGAYMAQGYGPSDLQEAIATLGEVPAPPQGRDWREQPGGWERYQRYLDRAREVLRRFPRAEPPPRARNIAVPTWFYGWEPTNLFADAVAKYFSNSLREDGLLAVCVGGVVYGPGSLGTTQEIFVDAAQNHYGSFEYVSPMAFLGVDHYTRRSAHWTLLQQLSVGRPWGRLMVVSDSPEEISGFIMRNRPVAREGAG